MARILIVEDNPDNMKLFRAVLEPRGHGVTGLASGDGLHATLEGARPELVLMDIQLPGRDGYELLADIRNSRWAGVRVVALTAHAMSGESERALVAGFDGYITKPIDIAAFPRQIARALEGHPPGD